MTNRMRICIYVIISCTALWICMGTVWGEENETRTLEELEQMAHKMFTSGMPETSLELYKRYEVQMIEEGWDVLNPDVISNLAIASYQSGQLGESMAYLKQLNIIRGSKKIRNEIDEMQMLIEHRVYQTAPNTAFVRGESTDYTIWEFVNRFTEFELNLYVIIVWTSFFIFLTGYYFTRRRGKIKFVFIDLMLLSGGCLLILCSFLIEHRRTSPLEFGVITSVEQLVEEPGFDGKKVEDPSYVPGMTVSVVSHIPGWVKVKRVDGDVCWVRSTDFYLLRGQGDRRSAKLE